MMLIATTVVASVLFASIASAAGAPAASSPAIPPMIVHVIGGARHVAALVARVLAETDAIWRPSGVTFVWRRAPRAVASDARATEIGPYVPNTLRLMIGDEPRRRP